MSVKYDPYGGDLIKSLKEGNFNPPRVYTATAAAAVTDSIIEATHASVAITITLPSNAEIGKRFVVKQGGDAAVTVSAAGDIDGGDVSLATANDSVYVYHKGAGVYGIISVYIQA